MQYTLDLSVLECSELSQKYVDEETEAAYRNTNYCVPTPDKLIVLRVDEASEDIHKLMAVANAEGAVFMTAHNPFGEFLEKDINTQANTALQKDLDANFPNVQPCYGASPDEKYREESFLVYPVNREQAIELCCRYQQNAVLFIGVDGVPELVFNPEVGVESSR